MGEHGGTNGSGPGALGAFERVGPLTLLRKETRGKEGEKKKTRGERKEIRGRFFFVVFI